MNSGQEMNAQTEFRYYDTEKKPLLKKMRQIMQGEIPLNCGEDDGTNWQMDAGDLQTLHEHTKKALQNPPPKNPKQVDAFRACCELAQAFAEATSSNLTFSEGPYYGSIRLENTSLLLVSTQPSRAQLARLLEGACCVTFDALDCTIDHPAALCLTFELCGND